MAEQNDKQNEIRQSLVRQNIEQAVAKALQDQLPQLQSDRMQGRQNAGTDGPVTIS